MKTLLNGGRFQAQNDKGPIPGALLYTYGAGGPADSTNYAPTYAGDNSTNPNPVVCNQYGQASVRLDPLLGYRVVLKTPQGVTIYDEDHIGGSTSDATLASSYASLSAALLAGQSKLTIDAGTYSISADADSGSTTLQINPGVLITVPDGVKFTIRKPIIAGNYQIFSTTGNVICTGDVNPMWWGAVQGIESLPAAKANKVAFRKAAKSLTSDYAACVTAGLAFNVRIPAGMFALSNGFAASVGVEVSGSGASGTYLKRLNTYYDDVETAIPLLTIGKTLNADLTIDTVNQQSPMTNFGATLPLALARDLYFTDQNPSGTLDPNFSGGQFSNLFFTSCNEAIRFRGVADQTWNNVVVDMGSSGLVFESGTQNIVMNGLVLYNINGQAIQFQSNVHDIEINGFVLEYPQNLGIYFGEGNTAIDNVRFSNGHFISNVQYTGFGGMIRNRASNVNAFFNNCNFRNIPGPAVLNDLVTSGCSFTFNDCHFDGTKSGSTYNQGSTMVPFSALSGLWMLNSCTFKNQFGSAVFSGNVTLVVNGLRYSAMNGNPCFNVTGATAGDLEFMNVKGDGTVPLLNFAGTGATVRVKSSSDWLGAPAADGSYYSWFLLMPAAGQVMAFVTAQTDATANVRKSASYIFEKSVELLPAMTDTITSGKVWASPVTNGHPELAPTMVFTNNTTAQATAALTVATVKLRVPNTYSNFTANVEYLN